MGTYLPGTGTLGSGPGVGLGSLAPEVILLNFYHPRVCGTSPFWVSPPITILDGYGFFNSTVVGLPFISISEGSE